MISLEELVQTWATDKATSDMIIAYCEDQMQSDTLSELSKAYISLLLSLLGGISSVLDKSKGNGRFGSTELILGTLAVIATQPVNGIAPQNFDTFLEDMVIPQLDEMDAAEKAGTLDELLAEKQAKTNKLLDEIKTGVEANESV